MEKRIRKFIDDYGIAQDFDDDDAFNMIKAWDICKHPAWIKTCDALPAEEGMIVVFKMEAGNGYGYGLGEYSPALENWYDLAGDTTKAHVTHWMRLE